MTGRPHADPARRGLVLWSHRLLRASTLALAVCTLAGFFGSLAWWLDLFDHFRVQGAAAGITLTGMAIALRSPRTTLTAASLFALNLFALASSEPSAARSEGEPALRALVFNVYSGGDPTRVAQLLDVEHAVDVVGLLEVTPTWASALQPALARWPHRVVIARSDNFGLLLASKWPLTGDQEGTMVEGLPIIDVTLNPPGRTPIDFVLVHPPPPMGPVATEARNESIRAYAKLHRRHRDGVLTGDFNTTLWSRAFDPLSAAGYTTVRQDWGIAATWPAAYGPMGIAIDHAFVRGDLTHIDFAVLGRAGSDHRPIRFTVGRSSP